MRHTRIRFTGAAILFAACLLASGGARSEEKEKAPPDIQELERDLKAKLAGRSPEEARALIEQLVPEWTVRKGNCDVARERFNAQSAELKKVRLRLAALTEPTPKTVPLVLRAADMDGAIKAAQQIAEYHATRVQHIDATVTATQSLLALGAEYQRAVRAANVHLELMRTAPGLVPGATLDKLPDAFATKNLSEATKALITGATDVADLMEKSRNDLNGLEVALANAKKASAAAGAKLEELKTGREAQVKAFEFEEQIQKMTAQQLAEEFARLRKTLAEKTAAIKGDADDYGKTGPVVTESRARLAAVKEPPVPPDAKSLGTLPPLEEALRQLLVAQQYLGARVRTVEERAEKTAALVVALDERENKGKGYSNTLDAARQAAVQLAAIATEVERRIGRGDLEAAKAPEGLAEVATARGSRTKLDADAAAVQRSLMELRAERDALRKPDADSETIKAQTAGLLARVTARIDLLADLKKRAAEYATVRKDRSDSDQRRMDQRAVDRAAKEAGRWDWFFALDRSKTSTDISDLIDAYYKELIDLDEKEDNLKQQREALASLVDVAKKEADDGAKLRAVLEKAGTKSEDLRKFDAWLASRLAPTGLKAESGLYHDELARLAVVGGANARRVEALTGNKPAEAGKPAPDQAKQPVIGGEISKAREELLEARIRGLTITGIKIGVMLIVALMFPMFVMRVLRRAIRGGTDDAGNPSPVLSALGRVLKVVVRVAAVAVILSILGFDVTALVVALAIIGLALAIAARPMIADVLGSLSVFADRRFKVGDVVRLGGGEPARVVGLTWRSTALRNNSGLVVSVPNRQVTETTVENLSRGTETFDTLAVTISTDKDAGKVINVIRGAIAQCKNLSPDHGVTVISYVQRGNVKVVQYRFWWFLKDYETRNKTRDEVFARIAVGLAHEDMTGIEVTLA